MTKKPVQSTAPQAVDQQNLSAPRSAGGETADDAAIPTRGSHAESRVDNAQGVAKDSLAELGTSRRGFIMNSIVSAAAVASATAIPSQAVPSLQQVSSHKGDLRALYAYASWLHMERRILCRELWPELGSAADKYVFANNAGFNWHIDGRGSLNWNEGPQPSSRAETVLDLVGVDWRADANPVNLEAHHVDEENAIDPIFAAIEAHRAASDAYTKAAEAADVVELKKRGADLCSLGALEAARDDADDAERERMWDLIWTIPTTPAGLASLLAYCRENHSINELVGRDEWEDVLEWTIECAVCAMAGLPKPPMDKVVASVWGETASEDSPARPLTHDEKVEAELISARKKYEELLPKYIDARLEWARLHRAARAEAEAKYGESGPSNTKWMEPDPSTSQAFKFFKRALKRNGAEAAGDRMSQLSEELDTVTDVIVSANSTSVAGLRAKVLVAIREYLPPSADHDGEFYCGEGESITLSLLQSAAEVVGLGSLLGAVTTRLAEDAA
jgi:hypothetical protein